MDFDTAPRYPSNAPASYKSTEIVSALRPGADKLSKKKAPERLNVNESFQSFIDEAWVPMNAFLDTLQEAVGGVDKYLSVRYWNTPMARLTGVPRDEALHRPLFSLLPRDFERHLAAELRRLFQQREGGDAKTAEVIEGEFSQRHGNSDFFAFAYRMRLLPIAENNALAILTLRPAVQTRNPQRRQEQETFGILGKLSASIVQEIAIPLDTICNKIDNILALASNKWGQRLDGELHSIITEVYQISHLINNIFTLSSSYASTAAQVDINSLILESIALLEHTLNRPLGFSTSLLPELPFVAGDPILLQCALQNILRYAVEAAGDDAVPKIQTGVSVPSSAKQIGAYPTGAPKASPRKEKEVPRQVAIRIEDRGAELTPASLAQLFDPVSICKKIGASVSIGLFISRRIIESHRGQIYAHSEPGRGTILTITLPI
jgi:signal transduction histidine kinase